MPFSLRLYDLFVAMVLGFLYLYVLSELLQLFGWRTMELSRIDTIGGILTIAVAAFISGTVLGSLSYNYWYKVFYKKHSAELSLARLVNSIMLRNISLGLFLSAIDIFRDREFRIAFFCNFS